MAIDGGLTSGSTAGENTIAVSTATELMGALERATSGTTILLASGNYGSLDLIAAQQAFAKFAGEVTIKSADPAAPAIFSALKLVGVENLTLDGVKFDYDAPAGAVEWDKPFQVLQSSGITIRNSEFEGDVAEGVSSSVDGYGTGFGLFVRQSSGVTIEDNTFHNWMRAAVFDSVQDLAVKENEVYDVRSDGFDFANVDDVLIEANYIHDFRSAPGSGDHPDMIQFWTAGTTSPSTNVVIRGNYLDSGGGGWTQSIFMRNEKVDQGQAGSEMFYRNILIEDNVIKNAHTHGITVGETAGLTITNNTILENQGSAEGTSELYVPTINLAATSQDVAVTNNIVPRLSLVAGAELTLGNNLIVQRDDPYATNYYGDLFVNALDDSGGTLADLRALPGSIIEQLGVGSALTRFDADTSLAQAGGQSVLLDGFIASQAGTGLAMLTRQLDVSSLFDATGQVDATGAAVAWEFGDGTTDSGLSATHAYKHAGVYDVSAVITLGGGQSLSLRKTIEVQTPVALALDFSQGATDVSDVVTPATGGGSITLEAGADGQAVRLNGDRIAYDAGAEFFNNSEFTVLFDFKKEAGAESAAGAVIKFPYSFSLGVGAESVTADLTTTAGATTVSAHGLAVDDAQWHQVAFAFSGAEGTAILYVDGLEVARATGLEGAYQVGNKSQDFYLGNPWGASFPGLIDNVAFVRGAVDADDARSLADGTQNVWDLVGVVGDPTTDHASPTPSNTGSPGTGTVTDTSPDTTTEQPEIVDVVPPGPETILGSKFDDVLTGNDADNILKGRKGDDSLSGLAGKDILIGGKGHDTFVFASGFGADTIEDYRHGVDEIDLTGTGVHSFKALKALMSKADTTVIIDFGGGDSLTIADTTIKALAQHKDGFDFA